MYDYKEPLIQEREDHNQFHTKEEDSPLISSQKKSIFVGLGVCAFVGFTVVFLLYFFNANSRDFAVVHVKSSIKPKRIRPGNTVMMVSPASPYAYDFPNTSEYISQIDYVFSNYFNLYVAHAKHDADIDGYLAGNDKDRAKDIEKSFINPNVNWIEANRGGYGCDRILPLLNYSVIKHNPKVICGYSDLTGL